MVRRALVIVSTALAVGGCSPRTVPQTGTVPQPNPQTRVASDVGQRVDQMGNLAGELGRLARQLPARDEAAQRDAMRTVFDLSARALPLLMGPQADGQFRLQQRIVADARDQLARGDVRLAQEPTVSAGLRAVYNALVRVSQESFYTSQSITADLTELAARVDALDTVRGPMHRDAAGRAVRQVAAVMARMARLYAARLGRRGAPQAVPNPKAPAEQPAAAEPPRQGG